MDLHADAGYNALVWKSASILCPFFLGKIFIGFRWGFLFFGAVFGGDLNPIKNLISTVMFCPKNRREKRQACPFFIVQKNPKLQICVES